MPLSELVGSDLKGYARMRELQSDASFDDWQNAWELQSDGSFKQIFSTGKFWGIERVSSTQWHIVSAEEVDGAWQRHARLPATIIQSIASALDVPTPAVVGANLYLCSKTTRANQFQIWRYANPDSAGTRLYNSIPTGSTGGMYITDAAPGSGEIYIAADTGSYPLYVYDIGRNSLTPRANLRVSRTTAGITAYKGGLLSLTRSDERLTSRRLSDGQTTNIGALTAVVGLDVGSVYTSLCDDGSSVYLFAQGRFYRFDNIPSSVAIAARGNLTNANVHNITFG